MHQGSFLLLPLTDITAKGCANFFQPRAKEGKSQSGRKPAGQKKVQLTRQLVNQPVRQSGLSPAAVTLSFDLCSQFEEVAGGKSSSLRGASAAATTLLPQDP